MIEVNGFTVYDVFVDTSVGITSVSYTIDGPFYFSSQEALEDFRAAICAAFELVCDMPKAITFEEGDRILL